MDNFDLAFVLLTNKAHVLPKNSLKNTVIKQAANVALWGPESILLGAIMIKSYKKYYTKPIKSIQKSFDLSGDITVNKSRATKALNATSNLGNKMWKDIQPKINDILLTTFSRSLEYYTKQSKIRPRPKIKPQKVKKADFTKQDYEAFAASALSDHIEQYTKKYPDRILHPEVKRMIKLAETNPILRTIDKHALAQRIEGIGKFGENYFSGMTDIQVGRAWTYTGLDLAYRNDVSEYMIIAQMDSPNKPCLECQALHGHHFSVTTAREKMVQTLAETDPEKIKELAPFPRFEELSAPDMTPEKISQQGYIPPFHGSGRCEVVFLWTRTATTTTQILDFEPAQTIKEAENWVIKAGITDSAYYSNFKNIDINIVNAIDEQLFELVGKNKLKFNTINVIIDDTAKGINVPMSTHMRGTKDNILYDLTINQAYFVKHKSTLNSVNRHIKQLNTNHFIVPETVKDIVSHEYGHRLTAYGVYSEETAGKLLHAPIVDTLHLSKYGSTEINESLAEIYTKYEKNETIPTEWKKIFNRYSEVKID